MANPQTQDVSNPEEIIAVNAKWVNGVAPGYHPTPGTGLTLNLSAGTSFARNVRASYAGGTLALTDNATNYIFLDTMAANAPSFNTSGYPTTGIPIATVVTASGAITTITDDRTWLVGGFATATLAGLVPTPPNDATKYLDGTANWSVPPGSGGGGSSAILINFADGETPSGTINGSNTAFSLVASPSPAASLQLFLNGQLLKAGGVDYALSGSSITMVTAPVSGDILLAWYQYTGSSAGFSAEETPSGTINGSNTAFSLVASPSPAASLQLFLNGQLLKAGGVDYALSGSSITMVTAPASGGILLAWYRFTAATSVSFTDAETPSGTLNGSNVTFTLAGAPNPSASLQLFLNGQLLKAGGVDYALSGSTITMNTAPVSTDILLAWYRH